MQLKTEFPNRLRLVTERLPHFKSVSVGIWVNIGSRDETEAEGGISHLIEHMIFKGTERRSALDIAKEIDQVGGMSNAFTSKEFTCFHARVMADHLSLVADLLTDIFIASRYDPEDLERERQVILQEIRMVEDTPDEMVHVYFSEDLWPGQAVGRPVMGTVETVGRITRENIQDYRRRNYLSPKIVIAAAGDVDHQRLLDLMGPAFETLPAAEVTETSGQPRIAPGIRIHTRDLEQVHVCLGTSFPGVMDTRRYTAALLNIMLGGNMSSRLFQEIRENRGLAYSVYSFYSAYLDTGMMGVYAGVDPQKTEETTRLIMTELAAVRAGDISPNELKAAQEHLKGSIILGSESADNRMTRLAKNEITYGRNIPFEEIIAAIDSVTRDQVVDLAAEFLTPENLTATLLGPVDETTVPGDLLS